MDGESLKKYLTEEGIDLDGEEILETLVDFANFTPEDVLEREFDKLKLFKLYDDKPFICGRFY